MKKFGLAVLLGLVMTSAAVFADHPGGWGIGGVWGSWRNWDSGYYGNSFNQEFGLSLKAPSLPVFWGVYFKTGGGYTGSHIGISVTGDYYIVDSPLVKDIYLNWYAGLGGRFSFDNFSSGGISSSSLFLGGRGVLGLSWQLPIGKNAFELFLDVAPSLGVDLRFGDYVGDSMRFPAGGWGWDFGFRVWL